MEITLMPLSPGHRVPVMDIFNYYVENSFAAYPENRLPDAFFDTLLALCQGYPAVAASDGQGVIAGFGMLRPYSPLPVFSHTAEITYFLKPGFTGKGIGKTILEHLAAKGKEQGLSSILASISSLNEGSLRFHLKNGFSLCGRFENVGLKNGRLFGVVYCQRML